MMSFTATDTTTDRQKHARTLVVVALELEELLEVGLAVDAPLHARKRPHAQRLVAFQAPEATLDVRGNGERRMVAR